MKLNNEIAQLTEIYNNPKVGLKSKDLLKQYIIDADLDISDEALAEFYKNYEPIQQKPNADKVEADLLHRSRNLNRRRRI